MPQDAPAGISPADPADSRDHAAGRRRHGLAWGVLRWLLALTVVTAVLRLTGCMERLYFFPVAEPTPPPTDIAGAEAVSFRSADGTRLTGWFLPATSHPAGGSVLHVHGNAGNVNSHVAFSAHLPGAGFNVLIFDYRGYGESEGRARRRGPLIADTHAALDALLARHDVDPQRVAIFGHSLGGAIALWVMAERPEVRAAVLESPFASWRGIAASALGGRRPGWFARGIAAALISDSHSPLDAVARIDRPILIVHGADDSIVPVEHAQRLAAAGSSVSLEIIPGGQHNTLQDTHAQVRALMVNFLREHLAGDVRGGP